jgi:PhnB protein
MRERKVAEFAVSRRRWDRRPSSAIAEEKQTSVLIISEVARPEVAGSVKIRRGVETVMPNKTKPIPDGYHSVTPYLVVPGIAKLIDFVKQAFGATELERFSRPDGTVQHAEVKIGDSIVMLGEPQDASKAMPATLYVYVTDTDATYQRAVQAGGRSLREPRNEFYGDRTAGVEDAFGNQWWIGTHIEDVSPEEMQRRAKAAH